MFVMTCVHPFPLVFFSSLPSLHFFHNYFSFDSQHFPKFRPFSRLLCFPISLLFPFISNSLNAHSFRCFPCGLHSLSFLSLYTLFILRFPHSFLSISFLFPCLDFHSLFSMMSSFQFPLPFPPPRALSRSLFFLVNKRDCNKDREFLIYNY